MSSSMALRSLDRAAVEHAGTFKLANGGDEERAAAKQQLGRLGEGKMARSRGALPGKGEFFTGCYQTKNISFFSCIAMFCAR